MLEQLPRRTHEWHPTRVQWGVKRTPEQSRLLTERLLEAEERGMSREWMKNNFNISQHTIDKLIGQKTKGRK